MDVVCVLVATEFDISNQNNNGIDESARNVESSEFAIRSMSIEGFHGEEGDIANNDGLEYAVEDPSPKLPPAEAQVVESNRVVLRFS